MILKSYKAEKLINTRNIDESKMLNSIQEFIKLHDESEWETCLADVLFCITLTGTKNKQESKKWNVKLLKIYDISIEINQIIQNYLDLEEEQLAQQLIEELNTCHDEKPCVLGDSLFDDKNDDANTQTLDQPEFDELAIPDEDENIKIFIELKKDPIQEKINQANADEIEEEKEQAHPDSKIVKSTVSSTEEEMAWAWEWEGYSDEMTVDTVEDLPQSSTIEKLEQACRAIATVSITTMLLSGAVLMTALAIHQVKTLF